MSTTTIILDPSTVRMSFWQSSVRSGCYDSAKIKGLSVRSSSFWRPPRQNTDRFHFLTLQFPSSYFLSKVLHRRYHEPCYIRCLVRLRQWWSFKERKVPVSSSSEYCVFIYLRLLIYFCVHVHSFRAFLVFLVYFCRHNLTIIDLTQLPPRRQIFKFL